MHRLIDRRGLSDTVITSVREIVWHTFMKLYFPSDVNRGDGVRLSVAPQNAAVKLGLGRQRLEILQQLNGE